MSEGNRNEEILRRAESHESPGVGAERFAELEAVAREYLRMTELCMLLDSHKIPYGEVRFTDDVRELAKLFEEIELGRTSNGLPISACQACGIRMDISDYLCRGCS